MKKIKIGIKYLIALWVLSGDNLSLLLSGYVMEVPIAKYFFTLFESVDGWGIETVFTALGLGCVFYLVRDRQNNFWVSCLSGFFAVCTVMGISYEKTDSWNFIFLFRLQFLLAVFVIAGFYFLYKNSLLFVGYILEKKSVWWKRLPTNRLEIILFEHHSFLGPFLFFFVCGLPWLIFYFPGTLHFDAPSQIYPSLGIIEMSGHFPVFISEWMGACIRLGRYLFHSDMIGVFLYTGPQFLSQILVFSYAVHVMSQRKVPVLICWAALLYWGVYPFFPIWGYTMVKDSLEYIGVVLLVSVLVEVISNEQNSAKGYQIVLFAVSVMGITLSRHDGRYVVLITILASFFAYRKYWKMFVAGICACLLVVGGQKLYMFYHQYPAGEVGEMLSIPLQQTARYLRDYYEELTDEEAEILQNGFKVELNQVGSLYNPVLSDPVKGAFVSHPGSDYMKKYFTVWFQQMLKHPDVYIQAFLNNTYGYFYPNVHGGQGYIAMFGFINTEHWDDGNLDVHFAVSDHMVRSILEHFTYLTEKIPIVGMFMSCGMQTYILLVQCCYLLSKRKKREMALLVPELCVLLVCIVSPVNAYLRYIMPIMAAMPLTLAWCYVAFESSGGAHG